MRQILRGVPLFVLPAVLTISVAGCVDITAGEARFIDTVEKRFTVSGAPSLEVSTFDGSVDVSTWDRPEVLVVIEKHALDKAAADRMIVTTDQNGDVIRVKVQEEKDGGFRVNVGSHNARITVTLPAKAQITALTGDGRVTVTHVEGDLRVRTGDGAIHLEQVNGSIDATTGDGRVEVRDVPFSGDSDRAERGTARGRLGSGGPTVSIRSGDGVITIRRSAGAS